MERRFYFDYVDKIYDNDPKWIEFCKEGDAFLKSVQSWTIRDYTEDIEFEGKKFKRLNLIVTYWL